MGVFNLIEYGVGKQAIHTERYCGWKENADEAKGEWVSHVMNGNPGLSLLGAFVDDITDFAADTLLDTTPPTR